MDLFGMTWVYATGDALTLPTERYFMSAGPPVSVNGSGGLDVNNNFYILSGYDNRNDFRQKAYHRFDFSATLRSQKVKKFKSEWVFAVYNMYGRQILISFISMCRETARTAIRECKPSRSPYSVSSLPLLIILNSDL
jgi:hypothetical protein